MAEIWREQNLVSRFVRRQYILPHKQAQVYYTLTVTTLNTSNMAAVTTK